MKGEVDSASSSFFCPLVSNILLLLGTQAAKLKGIGRAVFAHDQLDGSLSIIRIR